MTILGEGFTAGSARATLATSRFSALAITLPLAGLAAVLTTSGLVALAAAVLAVALVRADSAGLAVATAVLVIALGLATALNLMDEDFGVVTGLVASDLTAIRDATGFITGV